jgi:ATP-dependent DNA helicase PIF1
MLHQKTLDTIDGLLRFLTGNNRLFGGKTILFSGDTGQLSPVTKLPGREAAVAASIVSHPVMARIKVITLSASKRQANDIPFSTFCDSLADGNGQDGAFTIPVPESISITRSHDSALDWFLRDAIPPNAASTCPSSWPLYNSAVVAYTNGYVDFYNDYILNEVAKALQTPLWQSFATEEFAEINGVNLATPDYMESYSEPGTPEHTFKACLGARCTLTRNFLPSRGLVNGAFVMITGRTANTISVRNVTPGPFYGNEDILFRFTFNISVKEMFNFNRKQFPLRLAYAATVHKYQGDTIKGKLLVDCSNPSFTHGQLSVAISRGVASENIALCVSPTDFDNQSIEGLLYRDLLLERRGGKRSKREREH